jgi:phosphoribosylanthranilate isomerase
VSQRVRIKICGITRSEDALAAAASGADAIGLIFAEGSPRQLDTARAAAIALAVPVLVSRVGLFRDATAERVREVVDSVPLELLQFHGEESPEFCAQFGRPWLKAVPMGRLEDASAVAEYLRAYTAASGFVFDSHGGARSGGSGLAFDWSRLPQQTERPLILAGGLVPDNVRSAIVQVRPWAVDVSSGIESAPGIKDRAKMLVFVNEVYRAGTD